MKLNMKLNMKQNSIQLAQITTQTGNSKKQLTWPSKEIVKDTTNLKTNTFSTDKMNMLVNL